MTTYSYSLGIYILCIDYYYQVVTSVYHSFVYAQKQTKFLYFLGDLVENTKQVNDNANLMCVPICKNLYL